MQYKDVANHKFEHCETDVSTSHDKVLIEFERRVVETKIGNHGFHQGKSDIVGKNAKIPMSPIIPDAGYQGCHGQEHHDAQAVEVQGQKAEKFHRSSFGLKYWVSGGLLISSRFSGGQR
jgi:hypothetical protein